MTFMEEYQNVEKDLGLIALDDSVLQFQGKDLPKFLQGMLSNDIQLLKEGQELPACFLSAKGKWIASLHLFKVGNSIFAKTSPLEAKNLIQAIQPLILFSESQMTDVSQDYQWILGVGKNARHWDEKFPREVFQHEGFRLPSFLILCPRKEVKTLMNTGGNALITAETLEVFRIESGLPLYGQDVDEKTIPLEANLNDYFSYTKGCYVGQETISRIKHYGHVNKKLVKLKVESETLPELGAPVILNDKEVGKITSACLSPQHDSPLALAILQKDAFAEGTHLMIKNHSQNLPAKVLS